MMFFQALAASVHGAGRPTHSESEKPDHDPSGGECRDQADNQTGVGQDLEHLVPLGTARGEASEADDGEARQDDERGPTLPRFPTKLFPTPVYSRNVQQPQRPKTSTPAGTRLTSSADLGNALR
jgi:hypothetical protein